MGEHSRETNDERFRLIFTYLPTAAALVDESGRLQQVNPALGRLLGYRLEELAGRKLEDFLQPHDLNAKLLVAPPRYEQTEFSSVEETRILCRDGRSLWARLHVSWIPGDSDRRPLAVITWEPLAASTRTAVSRGKSRERYQALFDQFADEVYLHDGDGTILDLNQAAVNGSGYSRRELLGMTVFDLHPPDTDPADVRRQWKQWPVGRSHTLEYRHQRRDGSIYPVEITTGAVAINRQRLFLAIVRDITRRWRKEIEYAHILNTSLDGYWLLDAEGRLLEANPAAAEILGYPQGTLTGLTINDIEAEETAEQTRQHLARLRQAGQERFETRHRRRDGRLIDVEISTSCLPDNSGRIIAFTRDITDRKKFEEEMRQQQRSITLSNRIAQIFLISESEAIYADVLEVILEELDSRFGYFGYVDNQGNLVCPSMTRDIWDKCRVPDKDIVFDQKHQEGLWSRSLRQKKSFIANQGLTPPTGHLPLENALVVPILHGDRLIGQFAVANKAGGYSEHDRQRLEKAALQTAPILNARMQAERQQERRKQLEAQLRQAQKMESIGTLAGGIAHDFNNILSSVIGFTELSLDRVERETRLHRNLSEVLRAGLRAKDLVKQILTMSRREEQEKIPIAINPLVKETLRMLRSTIPSSIEFKETLSGRDLIIRADPTQIHQVIMNLATNAVHAMAEGEGLLEVSIAAVEIMGEDDTSYPDMPAGQYARLMVSDTGTGIPPVLQEKIFEPYFTTKKKGYGTGLGLSVVHGIVKSHQGHISVYSEPDRGTTFHVYLPLARSGEAISPDRSFAPLPSGREHLLLVDDELPIVEMMQQRLERLGYTVTVRCSSVEALAAFRASPDRFDLVITDMTMPQMTGDKLARAVKEIRPGLPIILCTGFSEKYQQIKAKDFPIDNFLMKPVDQRSLARTVRELLDRRAKVS